MSHKNRSTVRFCQRQHRDSNKSNQIFKSVLQLVRKGFKINQNLNVAGDFMQMYERNINSTVTRLDADHILTQASLLDLNHSMRVALTINLKTREIVDAKSEIMKAPLKICNSTNDLVTKLKGLKIERGINRKLVEALGTSDGCTHLYELALNAVRLTFNIFIGLQFDWDEWLTKKLEDDDFIRKATPHLKGACRPFKK